MAEQKNIGFNKGLVMSPSAGEDGEATVLHNLVVRRGELVNIEQPKVVEDQPQITGTLKFIHKVQNRNGVQENYIEVVEGEGLWIVNYNYGDTGGTITPEGGLSNEVENVQVLGNTLIITTSEGVYYSVWKDSNYVWLGKDFPDVELRFSLS
jgi:hypothetical protein